MKAIVKAHPKPGLEMQEVDNPKILPNQVLIKIKYTAICGTDVHIYQWDEWAQKTVPTPLIIGHEFMGTVAEIGSEVKNIKIGDRVSGEGHLTCGTCHGCRTGNRHLCVNYQGVGYHVTGCFSEFFALQQDNVFKLPEGISDEIAAILDPFGNGAHTALSFDLVGEDILIAGAGPIGLMGAMIAKHAGARFVVITDINDYRLELAKKIGVDAAINVSREKIKDVVKKLPIEDGFSVGLEMSGNAHALQDLIDHVCPGGQIGLLGILPAGAGINWDQVIFKMLTLKGICGREIFNTWYKTTHMLQSGIHLEPLITHKFKADDFQKGFDAMLSGKSGKVLLDWTL